MNIRVDAKTAVLCASILGAAAMVTIGGALDPPAGSVAPSYKTLAEIEPRTAINSVNTPGDSDSIFKITQPGSYYLPGNIDGPASRLAIEVTAHSVVIDLNGFRVQGAVGSLGGIRVTAPVRGLVVRNGQIAGWGGDGIDALSADDCVFENLVLANNVGDGLNCGKSCRITGCTATDNSENGFKAANGAVFASCTSRLNSFNGFLVTDAATDEGYAVFTNCTAIANDQMGFSVWTGGNLTGCQADLNANEGIGVGGNGGMVSACSANRNTGDGIASFARRQGGSQGGAGTAITGCSSAENGGDGFDVGIGTTVADCSAYANTGAGIHAGFSNLIRGNTCVNNGFGAATAAGILADFNDNRIEGNNVVGNDRGIEVLSPGNFIVGNTASGNTVNNYRIVADNVVGNIVPGALSLPISGSTGGSGTGTTNPWGNFSF